MAIVRLRDYFIDAVLPVWASVAFDDHAGQFMEGLQLDGSPDPSGIVRTRTAARIIYVFAQASSLGVAPDRALEKAERAFANLRKVAWIGGDRPGYARTIDYKTGVVTDSERDLYDHACVLLALAWLLKATGKSEYLLQIEELVAAMDLTLAAPHGGWAEDSIGSLPRRQNPHMHYFEACLALWEVGAGERYAARAGELFGFFRTRLFDDGAGVLREFFGPAWELAAEYNSSRLDPGHMSEWVWLVRRYDKLAGADHSDLCHKLLDAALRLGAADNTPFLVDETALDGKPLRHTRRLWLQAELLKAYIMQARATGDEAYSRKANALVEALFATYLADTPPGTWRDCFDREGRCVATSIPGSSLYHLWSGVAELV
ncbi:MAG: N-acylglucosamine 2-epimerase family protein [Rhizobium sp.]|nr:N-acylglucosamine 2-epimerase family protein [Rhizobium sp.]